VRPASGTFCHWTRGAFSFAGGAHLPPVPALRDGCAADGRVQRLPAAAHARAAARVPRRLRLQRPSASARRSAGTAARAAPPCVAGRRRLRRRQAARRPALPAEDRNRSWG
jgi:hypothetical protein